VSAMEVSVKSSEDCFTSFESILAEQAQFNLAVQTEADTRARLITKILRDALDWPEPNISREEYASPGFMDYVLSVQRRLLVVEAKKSGDSFNVPLDVTTSANFTLSGILRTVKNLNDYINQVLTYCFNNGIEYACVTNGLQWVVFRAVRTDGIHVGQGRVIVFKSLEDIKSRFAEFWALLSKEGVENNSLVRAFQPSESAAFQYKRILDELHMYSEKVTRNNLSGALEPLLREYMGEIVDPKSKEKLRELFVKGRALSEVLEAVEYRMNLSLSNTVMTTNRITQIPEADQLRKFVRAKIGSTLSLPAKGEVILLLGHVGSGKTTFVNHFLRIDLKDTFQKHFLVALDFRLLEKGQDIRKFFYETLRTILSRDDRYVSLSSKNLQKVFGAEIKELSRGPLAGIGKSHRKRFDEKIADFLLERYSDTENYFTRTLRFLADKLGIRCVVVFDNVDQLDAGIQQEVFTFAHSFAGNTHSLALVTMWEETYLRSKRGGSLSAYPTMAYPIPPTSVVDIIERRLEYILQNLQDGGPAQQLLPDLSQLPDVTEFARLLRQSLLHNKKRTRFFLESIALGNLRRAMEIFAGFVISGHTDAGKMLSIYRGDDSYDIPLHEFIKSVGLGDQRYYASNLSTILNLYSISDESRPSHFTKLRLLEYLFAYRTRTSFSFGMGFIPTETIKSEFARIGTSEVDILESLKLLGSYALVENDIYDFKTISAAYRITPAGRYYMRFLAGRFSYLDLVLQDTPISDAAVFRTIKKIVANKDMDDRFARVSAFVQYLANEEEREYPAIVSTSQCITLRRKFTPALLRELEEDKSFIRAGISRRREWYKGEATPYSPKEIEQSATLPRPDGDLNSAGRTGRWPAD
jgi:predicted type IV restriction endonuclease